MALHGSSVPIDVNPADKPVAVMVICPNAFAHQRLMQAINGIVPEAGEPTPQRTAEMEWNGSPPPANAYIAGFEPNEDGVIGPNCATGACGLD